MRPRMLLDLERARCAWIAIDHGLCFAARFRPIPQASERFDHHRGALGGVAPLGKVPIALPRESVSSARRIRAMRATSSSGARAAAVTGADGRSPGSGAGPAPRNALGVGER